MAILEKQKKYNDRCIKRVPLDMQKDYYEQVLKPAADRSGVPVNTYIKNAIREKIEREQEPKQDQTPEAEA